MNTCTCYIQSFKILANFCNWAGWFESYLVEKKRRHIFAWCGSNYSRCSSSASQVLPRYARGPGFKFFGNWSSNEPRHEKTCFRGFRLGQRTTKALIRLRGFAGWSAPLLFAYSINRFSHDVAQISTGGKSKHCENMDISQITVR